MQLTSEARAPEGPGSRKGRRQMSDKIRGLTDKLKNDPKVFRTAAVILVIAAALLVFGMNGKSDSVSEESVPKAAVSEEAGDSAAEDGAAEKTEDGLIYVDIGGAVRKPGVYELKQGARIFEAIEEAGGLTDTADASQINQAEAVSDGSKILIPEKKKGGADPADSGDSQTGAGAADGNGSGNISAGTSASGQADGSGKININTADSAELQKISGVGPATAQKIIDYRNQNGRFQKIEDLKNVSGIGDKTFEKLRGSITV